MPRNEFFKGWSVKALLGLDYDDIQTLLETSGESALRNAVTRLSSAANKRLRSLEAAGYGEASPAALTAADEGGRFSAKGKTGRALVVEFQRVKMFLENPTSTVKGAREWWNRVSGQNRKSTAYVKPPRMLKKEEPAWMRAQLIAILAKDERVTPYKMNYSTEEFYQVLEEVADAAYEGGGKYLPLDAVVEIAIEMIRNRVADRFGGFDFESIEWSEPMEYTPAPVDEWADGFPF